MNRDQEEREESQVAEELEFTDADFEEAEELFYMKYREVARDIHFYLKEVLEGGPLYSLARDSEDIYELLRMHSSAYGDVLVAVKESEVREQIEAEEDGDAEEEYMHFW